MANGKGKKMARSQSVTNFARTASFKAFPSADAGVPNIREYDQQLDYVFATKPPKTPVISVNRAFSRKASSAVSSKGLSRAGTVDPAAQELKLGEFVARDVYGRCEQEPDAVEVIAD
mmetsp:Transcript_12889/g.34728  ORF Transcript_12889/g.34728 Transcript_12889/m.34728 type:complete len:117 (-) Transcript_12889:48-398(-)|eukprot:CAMPEP_0185831904 /NCGR_PEP_ID=MMETSP1353-20130828/1769_1 /TAXON_ID=1077150 /ORGANISM="Erythrolobus australicus, Strain CCMP3124" /LENGTH=116 /DNA_ID=CAMNT_0028530017 /DNA_START=51 /DNA_END=401 /DNA_ORIENTATION=+